VPAKGTSPASVSAPSLIQRLSGEWLGVERDNNRAALGFLEEALPRVEAQAGLGFQSGKVLLQEGLHALHKPRAIVAATILGEIVQIAEQDAPCE